MLSTRRISWFLFPLLLAFAIGGCGDDESPTAIPDPLVTPPVPTDISGVSLSEDQITIDWEISSMSGISAFGIYRSDNLNTDTTLVDSTATTSYTDDKLVPGRSYSYQISSIGTNGLESDRSGIFTITPGTFGLLINNRDEYTNTRVVTLTFTAPGDIVSTRIGNDSLLTGSFFEALEGARSWTLPEGDGLKRVYARFRAAGGTVTDLYSAEITLDTRAEILSLTENSGGLPLERGDTLSIEMSTGEEGGTARVSLLEEQIEIPLFYHSNSGRYRADLVIPGDVLPQDAVISGTFTDRAGNVAAPYTGANTITVIHTEGSPTAVEIETASQTEANWIALSWTRNDDVDFAEYRLYRGAVPSVEAGDGDDQVIAVITDREVTNHVDSLSLRDTTQYYYRVFVKDSEDSLAGSNEVAVYTRNSPPPTAESFAAAAADSPSTGVELTWSPVSQTAVHDFAEYRIYRSTSEAVSQQSDLVGAITGDISSSSFVDGTTDQATEYYYRLYVIDRGALASGSGIESATTTDLHPAFPTLSSPNVDVVNQNVSLTWAANTESDFASYVIFFYGNENQTTPGVGSFASIDTVNSASHVTYAHYPNVVLTPYFAEYFIESVDRAGHRTRSNIVQAVFGEAGLPQISNIIVTARDTEAIITFETDVPTTATVRYSEESLLLDLTQAEGSGLQISHAITITLLTPASEYFYQLEVADERSIKNFSGIGSFVTDEPDTTIGGS